MEIKVGKSYIYIGGCLRWTNKVFKCTGRKGNHVYFSMDESNFPFRSDGRTYGGSRVYWKEIKEIKQTKKNKITYWK